MPLNPRQRRLRARIAARTRASAPDYDGAAATAAARAGYWDRIEREVDPAGRLAPAERRRKAVARWQARMDTGRLAKSRRR